jgi:hypothetical protein
VELFIGVLSLVVGYAFGYATRRPKPDEGFDRLERKLNVVSNLLTSLVQKVDAIMALDQDLLTAAQALEAEVASEEDSINELIGVVGGLSVGTVIKQSDVDAANAAVTSLTANRASVVAAIAKLPTPITLTPGSLTLSLAGTATGTFVATETANANAIFSGVSSATTIATVTQSGQTFTVTAVAIGVATVTVTDENGATAPFAVTVTA